MRPHRVLPRRIFRRPLLDKRKLLIKAREIRLNVIFVPGHNAAPPAASTGGFVVVSLVNPPRAFGKPQPAFAKPVSAFAKSKLAFVKPLFAFGKPELGFVKAELAFGKPESALTKPEVCLRQAGARLC
jgi:hypothetical protein